LPNGERASEVIVEDVSEVSRLQQRVAQSQKMDALGRLAGGVAHDFNNLLTIVLGQADLLLEDPTLAPEHKEQVREIYDASARGAGLNRQLLAFGRGRATSARALDLNQLLRDAERILRRAVGESVHLEMQMRGTLPVLADRSQVEQVLLNLVVNARDAMTNGGRLTIRTWEHVVAEDEAALHPNARAGAHVVLAVSDTGGGIPDDVLPFIFEPFYTTKSEHRGTGLGLATVYGVVKAAGGHVRLETVVGEGTSFYVFWPRHVGALDDSVVTTPSSAPRERAGRILLVEDETGVRRFIEQVLVKAGYRVTAAADGLEAIQLATRQTDAPFDLLITDIVMPGLSGHEVATQLFEADVIDRALLISGYPEGLPVEGPRGLSEWSFLAKPCTSNELLSAVRRLMELA
jgi:nitrogen-specific signal transduction histidine kinase